MTKEYGQRTVILQAIKRIVRHTQKNAFQMKSYQYSNCSKNLNFYLFVLIKSQLCIYY